VKERQILASLLQGGRLAADMTLADASSASGIPGARIRTLERGAEILDLETVLALLRAYDVDFSMFAVAFETATRAVRLRAHDPPLAGRSYDSPPEPSAPA
jgi:hypothetical protein